MAFTASDGKQFAHDGMGKSYEGALKAKSGGLGGKAPAAAEHEEQPAHEVVAQHGPAHTTQIVKDKKTGSHSVHSHHEDGHKHSSHGHDIESAHNHSMTMHGHDEENPQQDDTSELEATPSADSDTETSNMLQGA